MGIDTMVVPNPTFADWSIQHNLALIGCCRGSLLEISNCDWLCGSTIVGSYIGVMVTMGIDLSMTSL